MKTLEVTGMETLRTTVIGRNLAEAYDTLIEDQESTFPDVSRFEVIAARRISTEFRVTHELAMEAFDGQHTVQVWECEVFGHSE
jgi:hypothetical protein